MSEEPNLFGFSDAARRLSDAAQTAITLGRRDQWMAFALSDGRVQGAPDNPRTYPRRQFAVQAQGHDAANYGYLKIPWDSVTPRAAEVMLKLQRQTRAIDHQLVDPEVADHDYVPSNLREHFPDDRRRILASTRLRTSGGGLILP